MIGSQIESSGKPNEVKSEYHIRLEGGRGRKIKNTKQNLPINSRHTLTSLLFDSIGEQILIQ